MKAALARTPPLFAVWHVYKFCCTLVRREFFTVLAYVERGVVKEWVPAKPHLRNTELIVGVAFDASW